MKLFFSEKIVGNVLEVSIFGQHSETRKAKYIQLVCRSSVYTNCYESITNSQ